MCPGWQSIERCQDRNSRQEPWSGAKAKAMEKCCLQAFSSWFALFCFFSYTSQYHLHRDGTTRSGLGRSLSIIRKCHTNLPSGTLLESISRARLPFPDKFVCIKLMKPDQHKEKWAYVSLQLWVTVCHWRKSRQEPKDQLFHFWPRNSPHG